MEYKFLFGPIPSRRLGTSLGVDLIPHKICNLNCVYCESGITNRQTNVRKEYIPVDKVIAELSHYLNQKPALDYITFSGAGEPLLNSGIGKVVHYIKNNHQSYKIAVITNGLLLQDSKVRKELLAVDLVLPSLDASVNETFKKINRPLKEDEINNVIDGLSQFRKEFKGKIWLEVFFLPDYNDDEQSLVTLKESIFKINPDIVQLNTLDRPGTKSDLKPLNFERLIYIREFLNPLPVEIVSRANDQKKFTSLDDELEHTIISAVKRRPCTKEDLLNMINADDKTLTGALEKMMSDQTLKTINQEAGIFYKVQLRE